MHATNKHTHTNKSFELKLWQGYLTVIYRQRENKFTHLSLNISTTMEISDYHRMNSGVGVKVHAHARPLVENCGLNFT